MSSVPISTSHRSALHSSNSYSMHGLPVPAVQVQKNNSQHDVHFVCDAAVQLHHPLNMDGKLLLSMSDSKGPCH